MRATVAKIYLNNLQNNIIQLRKRISPDAKMCIAIKADAYGHGAVVCAKEAVKLGADYLAVATVDEGIELRNAGITVPLLLLSLCQPPEIADLVKFNLTPLVFDNEYIDGIARECKAQGKKDFAVHLAVDSGMGRIGCLPEDAGRVAEYINSTESLKLGGMCTHFSVADCNSKSDLKYTEGQFKKFMSAVQNVKDLGIDPGIRHCANSALTLLRPDMHLDMCRPGIVVYGYYPGDFDRKTLKKLGIDIELKPVMALESEVCAIRDFVPGMSVSYGRKWTSKKPTKIAVLPVGYADGLFRCFNQDKVSLKVTIGGREYPVCGRICMDQCMVDLGADNTDVKRWDKVLFFGPEESGALQSAQKIADDTKTISYEITCGVSKRVPRVFIEGV